MSQCSIMLNALLELSYFVQGIAHDESEEGLSNISLPDTSKALPTIADFFVLIVRVYGYLLNSSHILGKATAQFRLSDTRLSFRYASIKVISTTFLATLADVSVRDRGVEAVGLRLHVKYFQFVLYVRR